MLRRTKRRRRPRRCGVTGWWILLAHLRRPSLENAGWIKWLHRGTRGLRPPGSSNLAAVIRPVQQGLPLSRPAGQRAGLAVALDLAEVAPHRLPALICPGPRRACGGPYGSDNTIGTSRADRPDEARPLRARPRSTGSHPGPSKSARSHVLAARAWPEGTRLFEHLVW